MLWIQLKHVHIIIVMQGIDFSNDKIRSHLFNFSSVYMFVPAHVFWHVCVCVHNLSCMHMYVCECLHVLFHVLSMCMCVHLYLNEYVLTYMYHNSLLKCNIAALLFFIWYRYGSTCQLTLACLEHGNEIWKLQYYHHHSHLVIVVEVISDLGPLNKT